MAVGENFRPEDSDSLWMRQSALKELLEPTKPSSPAEAKFAEIEANAKAERAALDVTLQKLDALSPQVTTAAVAAGQAGKVERLIGTV